MAIPVGACDLRHLPKEVRALVRAAELAGWAVSRTRRSHIRLRPVDKTRGAVTISGTPSDKRSLKNLRADLRRAGLDI